MANFVTDGKICIERELDVTDNNDFADLLTYFDVFETCKWIQRNNFLKVCLQFPDELLGVSVKVYEEIKNRCDVDLYILGDTSYASCCVDTVAAMHVQGDAVVHYGHSCFSHADLPVFTVLPKKHLDMDKAFELLRSNIQSDDISPLCLFYDPDLEHLRDKLAARWYQQYPKNCIAFVEMEDGANRFLGRVVKNAAGEELPLKALKEYTCVYVGARGQTLFNFSVSVEAKRWRFVNTEEWTVEDVEESAWFKRRRFLVEACRDARGVGVLVAQAAGARARAAVGRVKALCRAAGKRSYIVAVGKPNVAKLANFPEIDIYVMIACPENELYSSREFYKPIVYPYELEVALNPNREPLISHHVTDYNELLEGKNYYCEIGKIVNSTDVSLITGKIRETKVESATDSECMDLVEKQNWALENIGQNLQDRSWRGLEQKLGQTDVKKAEEGRKGIPLQYSSEPQ